MQFRRTVEALDGLAKQQGWDLRYNMNKYYPGFKLGNKVVFNVHWGGTYTWSVRIKVPEAEARAFSGTKWEFQRYSATFNQAVMRPLQPNDPDIEELKPMLTSAYQHVSRG